MNCFYLSSIMDALIVYPENNEQLVALKAVMKTMKVSFEQKGDIYPEHVLIGINKSMHQANEGQLTPYRGIDEMLHKS